MVVTVMVVRHGCSVQSLMSVSLGHAWPPYRAAVHVRVRVIIPCPQVTEHELYCDHAPTTLSTAQLGIAAVQAFVCERLAHRAPLPPNWAGTVHERVRTMTPRPHVTEQAPYADQTLAAALIGQGEAWQFCCSVVLPTHAAPPNLGCTHARVLVWIPCPQVTEHLPKLVHCL